MTKKWKKRPQFAPREITGPQPGVTYCDPFGLQVRICINGERHGKYIAYSDHRNDAIAAHRAAEKWRKQLAAKRKVTPSGRGPREVTKQRHEGGVAEYAVVVSATKPDGTATKVSFNIGTDNTKTAARRKEAWAEAEAFYDKYQTWRAGKGRHPMEGRA